MILFGLEEDMAELLRVKISQTDLKNESLDPQIINYQLSGLKNFYDENQATFRQRLRKGPPADFRWLVWKFLGDKILNIDEGLYKRNLSKGQAGIWSQDIERDTNRTFPTDPLFQLKEGG